MPDACVISTPAKTSALQQRKEARDACATMARPMPLILPDGAVFGLSGRNLESFLPTIRRVALAVFIAVPIIGLLVPSLAGRVVWTILIAALPLFIVLIGYHPWRRVCPLAFFAQLPERFGRAGTHKAPLWLETNYYFVACSIFLLSLWLRLVATNGHGVALAAFFLLISFAALASGLFFTGKTWCNYLCPVSFIEKIYTEPRSLADRQNSQCAKCTACKRFCPDISQENGYWKEIDFDSKRFVYFAYPGLVFGFYFYYYLQSGTWDYYFGGRWTYEPSVLHTAFHPGHNAATGGLYFLPAVPRAVASIVTLVACALISYFLFFAVESLLQDWLRRRDGHVDFSAVRHRVFTLASFTAFVTFYNFAGAPTLRLLPGATQLTAILVVIAATAAFLRRMPRTPNLFAEDSLARNIVKRWPWADMRPPKNLHDAFLIHTTRSHETSEGYARLVETYKGAVRESLADGFITCETVNILLSFRSQLQIKQADHERVMAELADEERARMSDSTAEKLAEKRLQLAGYGEALKAYLERVLEASGVPDDRAIARLQREYGVTKSEHAEVLFNVFGDASAMPNSMVLTFLESQAGRHGRNTN